MNQVDMIIGEELEAVYSLDEDTLTGANHCTS